jgi:hypothetical protein
MNYQREIREKLTGLTPGANVVDDAGGLDGVEGESIGVKGSSAESGPETPLSALALNFPHPAQQPTDGRDSSLNITPP